MNYRYSWPDRPIAPPISPFTCPHAIDHPTLSMRQVQGPTPTHPHCTLLVFLFIHHIISKTFSLIIKRDNTMLVNSITHLITVFFEK